MGRYAVPLATKFADFAGVTDGDKVVAIGCGTGALTAELVRPGGRVAGAVWDSEGGMRLLGQLWEAAQDADARAGAETLRFGGAGELTELFAAGGLESVQEERLEVSSTYADFDELWGTLLLGVGPVGAYVIAQDQTRRNAIRSALFERLGAPNGQFALGAVARAVVGVVPG